MDLFSPIRDHGHLQPIRSGLDDRPPGKRNPQQKRLIQETIEKQGIIPGQLVIHADRGSSMTSKPVAFLLADLGVTKTHSRPHTSNDNLYSKIAVQDPTSIDRSFKSRFGSIENARSFKCYLFQLVQQRAPPFTESDC